MRSGQAGQGRAPTEKMQKLQRRSQGQMKKQIPHAAKGAGFGMPILRGIGISNRNTPELKTGLSRLRSTTTPVLIATLSTTRRRSGFGTPMESDRTPEIGGRCPERQRGVEGSAVCNLAFRHTLLIANVFQGEESEKRPFVTRDQARFFGETRALIV